MKIAVASDDGKIISSHLGRTNGFVVFEIVNKVINRTEYRPNTFTGHARGFEGMGHEIGRHGPIINALSDCKVVISHGMGRRLYDDLTTAGIEVYVTDENDVQKAVDMFINGKLIDNPDITCSHGHNP